MKKKRPVSLQKQFDTLSEMVSEHGKLLLGIVRLLDFEDLEEAYDEDIDTHDILLAQYIQAFTSRWH